MWSILVRIAAYGLIAWGISTYFPQWGFDIVAGSGTGYGLALVVVAIVIWFMERIIKRLLKIVTVPLNIFTFGLAGVVVNVVILYVIQFILPLIPGMDVSITLGSFIHIIIVSFVLSLMGGFISSLL